MPPAADLPQRRLPALWDLDPAFLDSRPRDGEILDHLRAQRKLEEQADFRSWKQRRALRLPAAGGEPPPGRYLPDGRTLRVLADPNPQGGLTYLFDDVSDRMKLESRYNALIAGAGRDPGHAQGAGGGVRRRRPPDLRQPRLRTAVAPRPGRSSRTARTSTRSSSLPRPGPRRGAVARHPRRGGRAWNRAPASPAAWSVADGTVLDCAAQPLPRARRCSPSSTSTASVNVERALTEKNDALEKAAQLRDTFVHHVSYELRSPLTNIIGFTQLLGDETVGALNARAARICRPHHALVGGAARHHQRHPRPRLDRCRLAGAAARGGRRPGDRSRPPCAGIEDRLAESASPSPSTSPRHRQRPRGRQARPPDPVQPALERRRLLRPGPDAWRSSARRDAQDSSSACATTAAACRRDRRSVFNRFESHTLGTRHRGVGLGLSIVRSFVELHGGRVPLETAPGSGTCVTCTFPTDLAGQSRHERLPEPPTPVLPPAPARKPALTLQVSRPEPATSDRRSSP